MSIAHNSGIEKISSFHSLHETAIGIDVHANLIVGCYQNGAFGKKALDSDNWQCEANKKSLHDFADWCKKQSPEVLIMESTGVYWQSLYESLEDVGFTSRQIIVVNARDVKNKSGSKTDIADAMHLAEVARQGCYKASFVPPKHTRQLRCLWRAYANAKNTRKKHLNVLHKELCQVGCRASSVFSDIRGKTATKILTALIDGAQGDVLRKAINDACSHVGRGRLKATPEQIYEALESDKNSLIWFSIKDHLNIIHALDNSLAERLQHIKDNLNDADKAAISLLMTVPGIKELTAIGLVAELGHDLNNFTSVRRFCRWIGLAPGNNVSAGKRYSGSITHGNKYLKTLLIECASGIGLMKNGYLHEIHQRFKERRGTKRANVALAHKLCRIIYAVLKNQNKYQENSKPVLKEHRVEKARQAFDGLADVGFVCPDIEVSDPQSGSKEVIRVKRRKRKTLT